MKIKITSVCQFSKGRQVLKQNQAITFTHSVLFVCTIHDMYTYSINAVHDMYTYSISTVHDMYTYSMTSIYSTYTVQYIQYKYST